jgi:hypothetical protein
LNPANVIVLPLILGIGIDDGIHVIHDLRRTAERRTLKAATINGIVMTSLTSMVGFGSLMLAQHEGLRSLGRVVTLGITCCLLSSTLWLPCLLSLLSTPTAANDALTGARTGRSVLSDNDSIHTWHSKWVGGWLQAPTTRPPGRPRGLLSGGHSCYPAGFESIHRQFQEQLDGEASTQDQEGQSR